MDTQGADVIPDVWALLEVAYEAFGVFPTLLERDFNIPAADELMLEVRHIAEIQDKWRKSTQENDRPRKHA